MLELSMNTHRHPCAGLPAAARTTFDRIVRGRTARSAASVRLLVDLALVRCAAEDEDRPQRYIARAQLLERWMDWHSFDKRERKAKAAKPRSDPGQLDFWPTLDFYGESRD